MASSPASSDLSDPPSAESEGEEHLSTAVPSSRPSVDMNRTEQADDQLAPPPSKRRKTGSSTMQQSLEEREASAQPAAEDNDDVLSVSSDDYSSAPGSPTHDEYALRDEAQTTCLWKDCQFGDATNNDELVKHVQSTHCATGGPKKTKYVCEWGECQRKTSNHPSGYALKAHMRSHTKEKPYYCALPECDKAFTRSDALAKHMRTVHEPEPPRNTGTGNNTAAAVEPVPPGKKSGIKIKLTNGTASAANIKPPAPPTPTDAALLAPSHDEDGNPVTPSHPHDNIQYIPAHHPITGQPGFMITYPPDVHFSAWESTISADQLLRLLRRQVHWAEKEGEDLKSEVEKLEQQKRQEFVLKEKLLDGVLEEDFMRGERDGWLDSVPGIPKRIMEADARAGSVQKWSQGTPAWRNEKAKPRPIRTIRPSERIPSDPTSSEQDEEMADAVTPPAQPSALERTPSPPPTGHSGGGFDGDDDPYDNYLASRMAEYEERQRLRSLQNTPQKQRQEEKEADAVGALVGLSGQ